jgi:hypothetical protein
MRRMSNHHAKSDENRAPVSILDAENWLKWNVELENPNNSRCD